MGVEQRERIQGALEQLVCIDAGEVGKRPDRDPREITMAHDGRRDLALASCRVASGLAALRSTGFAGLTTSSPS